MSVVPIVSAQPPDAVWIADLIGGAFQYLSVSQWLVPDPVQRARVLPRNFQIFVEYGLQHGRVHVLANRTAAAVWLPRGGIELPPPDDYDRRLVEACGPWTERFEQLDELFELHHPDGPHHHLAFLAVRPDSQGAGLGSRLLDYHHETLDRDGIPAFLEASSTGARDLYLRKGYELRGDPYTAGPDTEPHFWPMWREPR